jgi:GNAT superfamily N-acetyltransferase
MKLDLAAATNADAAALADLHREVADDLTRRFSLGHWSSTPSERVIRYELSRPKFSQTLVARAHGRIVATLRLATKKPWAIDTSYFTVAPKPLYLTGMAVHPRLHRQGVGRQLLKQAEAIARLWPAEAIRLDAYDGASGAGPFYAKCGYREVAHVAYKQNPLIYFELLLSSPTTS